MVESIPLLCIYLDVCCLNRPFDDQRQGCIRLESETVLLILGHCEAGSWQWIGSAVVEEEVNNTPSNEHRHRVRSMLSGAHSTVALTETAVIRAEELTAMGFRTYDALHLACAEQATVNIFLTTDDCVLRIAASYAAELHVRVENPLAWLMEVR
jgi:hypothetical protein